MVPISGPAAAAGPPASVSAAAPRSPAHGFCDDEESRRLLRTRPPGRALAWAAAQLGGPVISANAIRGGMSSAVHLLTVQRTDGRRSQAVLRRYVRPDLNAEEPDIAEREARALVVAEAIELPTPRLLAVDPTGVEVGVPALLMSRLPGNVLWLRGAVSGVVDWQAASIGPAAADVAHCRVNLLTIGSDVAERFTDGWERAAGASYHPWADVVTIIGFLDDLRADWGSERYLVEEMLARAVSDLGASQR